MWRIHSIVYTLKSITWGSHVWDKSKQTFVSFQRGLCQHTGAHAAVSLIVFKTKTTACLSKLNLKLQHMFQQDELSLSSLGFHLCHCLQPVATCSFMIFPPFSFLQTLHIYCSHTSHIASASYSSSGSHGLNHGECMSSDIYGWSLQLAWIHVCRENMIPMRRVAMVGSITALLTPKRGDQYFGTLQFYYQKHGLCLCFISNSCLGLFNVLTQQQCHWSCVQWVPCTLSEKKHHNSLRWQTFKECKEIKIGKRENSVNFTDMMNISSILWVEHQDNCLKSERHNIYNPWLWNVDPHLTCMGV